MDELITGFVGLDAHAESTAIGLAEAGRAAPRFIGTVGPQRSELTKALGRLGEPASLLIVYEAGPCGYGLARELRALGYRCEVVAPSKIPKRAGERVKTDRRDALKLASLARAGELTPVTVPDERDEALRDLCRARVDAVRARLKARQQLQALLLRDGRAISARECAHSRSPSRRPNHLPVSGRSKRKIDPKREFMALQPRPLTSAFFGSDRYPARSPHGDRRPAERELGVRSEYLSA